MNEIDGNAEERGETVIFDKFRTLCRPTFISCQDSFDATRPPRDAKEVQASVPQSLAHGTQNSALDSSSESSSLEREQKLEQLLAEMRLIKESIVKRAEELFPNEDDPAGPLGKVLLHATLTYCVCLATDANRSSRIKQTCGFV
eukprot:CAMPEP_0167772582 /NCGR_PEP_ID=MMETSP0111_2-20121227/927_1 /TAXON_ID=91324 /ORGANISM="Lotharella globosa, Strain CCCM811" /LENGTH=143 /DNA_ID=CAMNT_0007662089 /DNA_START=72 /DNA_END=501 /DNA_ORIENTATION=+